MKKKLGVLISKAVAGGSAVAGGVMVGTSWKDPDIWEHIFLAFGFGFVATLFAVLSKNPFAPEDADQPRTKPPEPPEPPKTLAASG